MRLLALDQASRISGYAVFEDGKLIDYGKIDTLDDNVGNRLVEIRERVKELINKYNIDNVALEDIMMGGMSNNVATHKVLAEVLGVLEELAAEQKITYQIIPAASWKFGIGLKTKKRADQKKEMQEYVLNNFGMKVTQDEADAIGIGLYYIKQNDSAF